MSIQNQFFTSFIKGIAKTTGSLTVLSAVALLWQLYATEPNTKQVEQEETKNNQEEQVDLECSFIDCNNDVNTINENMETKFKKIFDKM
jgi:UDP-2,3-diacylglucosamine pyrophosphatase LpxH